jgi:aspartyl aminopeptidase
MATRLAAAGYRRLEEGAAWSVAPGDACYLTRNDSSLIAFRLGDAPLAESGIAMVGAHTDSPCLKVKPQPELHRNGYLQLGVEVYGGTLLNPWFDRDLALAGRINYEDGSGTHHSCLLDFARPVAVIPSLAIHLDREVNSKRSINAQTDLPPLLMQTADSKTDFRQLLGEEIARQYPDRKVGTVLDYELCLYDCNKPAVIGMHGEFIASARLDNLLSCFAGLHSLLNANTGQSCLLVCNDHEEVGSSSAAGAAGPFLEAVLQRLNEKCGDGSEESYRRMLSHSLMLSTDNAHGIHPNFADKHDSRHGPLLNGGPVLKFNANQRYATNSETSARFRRLCRDAEVPLQSFVVRSDMGCGSTIGPIVAAELGLQVLDLGVPTFAMHSIRELAGSADIEHLCRALTRFYSVGC